MDRTERKDLKQRLDQAEAQAARAYFLVQSRQAATTALAGDAEELWQRRVHVRTENQEWVVIPLGRRDSEMVHRLTQRAAWVPLTKADRAALDRLQAEPAATISGTRRLTTVGRIFSGRQRTDAAEASRRDFEQLWAWLQAGQIGQRLTQLEGAAKDGVARLGVPHLLDPELGFTELSSKLRRDFEVRPISDVAGLAEALAEVERAGSREAPLRKAAEAAAERVREATVRRLLSDMPLDAVKKASNGRLRLGALSKAGITSVQEVLDAGYAIEAVPGVGESTAAGVWAAAQTIRRITMEETPVRIDIHARHADTTELLRALRAWSQGRVPHELVQELERTRALAPLLRVGGPDVSHLIVKTVSGTSLHDAVRNALDLASRLRAAAASVSRAQASEDPWPDFERRAADYYGMLAELGILTEDEDATHGHLPEEIVEAVRKQDLETKNLRVSLRGYQSFGARFALVQRKVVIGDEMGLGKTVEALAVLGHLAARGGRHGLVVCPAAVVSNWVREVRDKTALRPYRLHGPGRDGAYRAWVRGGGVAVTTFETLRWFEEDVGERPEVACVVIDEAHYVKNPKAQRSRRCVDLIDDINYAVLMTGTPLENNLEEFRTLVRYVQPELVLGALDLAPRRFRREVAPAYLRRNTEDVLSELPELVEVDEWLPMTAADLDDYRMALSDGNFMAMRRAAMLSIDSAKRDRLMEIVQEAEENGRKVLVFSYFKDVLSLVADALPGAVFGPLTGSVPADRRQQMVDQFTDASGGAVLVAQIAAGGVGLNIQAASVVVICEPQVKPTLEAQAIRRAHRMGQVNTVQVHRLLNEDSVDERMVEILSYKQAVFDEFARLSEVAESTPEAIDVTETDLAKQVIDEERKRHFGTAARADAAGHE